MYKQYYGWLFASLAISIGIQLILPYPYGLIVSLGFFVMFPIIYKKMNLKMVLGNSTGVFKRCGVCGAKSNDRQCGRCGSKQFRFG